MPTVIPSEWPQAAVVLSDLRSRSELDETDWSAVLQWLSTTSFDDRSYLAGEVAAGLVRDLAPPSIRRRFVTALAAGEGWHARFREIIESPSPVSQSAG